MIKIQVKFENEEEKEKVIKLLSENFIVSKVSEPYKTGRYKRVYLDIK